MITPHNLWHINFPQHFFEQAKYLLTFAEGKMRYGGTPGVSGRAKNWTRLSPNPLIPRAPLSIPKTPPVPTRPLIHGCWFLYTRHGRGKFSFSIVLHFYPLYNFISGCAVDKPAELEGVFLQHVIQCLPVGLHMELCEWARVAECILPGAVK